MRRFALLLLSLALLVAGCGGGSGSTVVIVVSLSPTTATVVTGGTQKFNAAVSGDMDDDNEDQIVDVTWFVNDVEGGNSTVGTISNIGLYTAPLVAPDPNKVTIKAVSIDDTTKNATAEVTIDSGIRISLAPLIATVGLNETTLFTATVTGTSNLLVKWLVNDIEGGNSTVGTISTSGLYTAPASVPASLPVTVKATSVVDPARAGEVKVTVVSPEEPTLTSISPSSAAQGSLFQDVYLSGTGFITTSVFRLNGFTIPAVSLSTLLTSDLVRVRIPGTTLAAAGTISFTVSRQSGTPSAPFNFTVVPVRPVLVGSTPDSGSENGSTFNVNINGGYYSPSVTAAFDGQLRAAAISNSRQLQTTISAADLATAGLFSLSVRNPAASPQFAASNLAVQPASLPTTLATLAVGNSPSAVAVNTSTGIAVIANSASNSITRIDLNPATPVVIGSPIAVGAVPTGVAVDNVRNVALVVNSGDKTLSVVNLTTGTVTATVAVPALPGNDQDDDDTNDQPVPSAPFAVDVNPLSGFALVANSSKNFQHVFDLATNTFVAFVGGTTIDNVSTGVKPAVTIEPGLNWAIITPGGATGTTHIIDLGLRKRLITANFGVNIQGIGLNTETKTAVITNRSTTQIVLFSYLDQVVRLLEVEVGHVAAAANPLTDIGVSVNELTNTASILDLRTPTRLNTISVGTAPGAVAIDPGSNRAVVVNNGSNNVSILSLGAIRPLHVTQISPPTVFNSAVPIAVNVVGFGFLPGATVRLDEVPVSTVVTDSRNLVATIPTSLLSSARRFSLDVLNPGSGLVRSNVTDFTVIRTVPVGTGPRAVAIDPQRDVALVTNSGSDSVSIVDLLTGSVINIPVESNPQGVAVIPRLGLAVVTNRGSDTASIINLLSNSVLKKVNVGNEPLGVAINQDTATAVVTNAAADTVTTFSVTADSVLPVPSTLGTDQRPVAVAIDASRNVAAVVCSTTGSILFVNLTGLSTVGRVILTLSLPTDITYDPASDRYLTVASLTNQFAVIDPANFQTSLVRVGVNPTSLAYNFQTGTLATVNTASRSLTVMDFLDRRVRAILPMTGSDNASIQIHPRTNVAVVADQNNNRVLIVPLPH